MSVDRYWNNTVLVVTCSASPFVEARHAYTVTQGSVTVTFESGVKPGSAWAGSAYFSGSTSAATGNNGTQLRLSSTDDFTLGTGDFTIEGWASADTLLTPTDTGVNEYLPHPIIERSNATAGGAWSLEFYGVRTQGAPDVESYSITFYAGDFHSSNAMLRYDFPSFPTGFHHYAVTRNGNEWTLWVDGEPVDRELSTVTIATPGGAGADIRIGNSILDTSSTAASQTNGRAFEGYIADIRITKGFCRYGRSFEAAFTDLAGPGAPLPTSEDTGDYTSETFRGATGSAGANAELAEDGEPGEGGAGIPIALPAPTPQYDQQNENQTRRLIEAATRR